MKIKNKKIVMISVIVLIGAFYLMTSSNAPKAPENVQASTTSGNKNVAPYEIYGGDVVEKIKNNEDIVLLDVRTPEEYQQVHLQNALLLPVQQLTQDSLNQIGLGEDAKNKEILIYCRSGNRSKSAYDMMKSLGYTNIKSVAGGMNSWQENNYPYTE